MDTSAGHPHERSTASANELRQPGGRQSSPPYATRSEATQRGPRLPTSPSTRSAASRSAATATASSTAPRSAASSTRPRSSSTTRATTTGRGSRTRWRRRRSRARSRESLRLNEDLAEAVALAHDLGHTPLRPRRRARPERAHGAARRVRAQRAEPAHRRRARGALSELPRPEPDVGGARGHRQALAAVRPAAGCQSSSPAQAPCLEAQIVDLADEIAYNSHDIDDGFKSEMLTRHDLARDALDQARATGCGATARRTPAQRIQRYQDGPPHHRSAGRPT